MTKKYQILLKTCDLETETVSIEILQEGVLIEDTFLYIRRKIIDFFSSAALEND